MANGKTVAFHTLGCKLNFAETSTLARQFAQSGFSKIDFSEAADVFVINTCSVTEDSNRECRRIVRNALRNSPEAFVIVTGCYAQLKPEEIANIKGVDLIVGANEKFNLLNFMNGGKKNEKAEIHSCEIEDVNTFIGSYSTSDRTRAFLKVQDGCDYTCSYCTIPFARGASRSDSISNIVNSAEQIAAQGIKEIVLTGVNIGDFNNNRPDDNGKETFFELIQALDAVQGISRFRISSIEPNLLTDEIIKFVARSEKFVPHFHIPLQSGSNKILGLMRRRYKRELYAERIEKIKSLIPHCCIGVDVIVGFPGETEDDFMDTYHFIDSLDISYLHVFTYSERENTEALKFKPVIPVEERRKRNKILRNLSNAKQMKFYSDNAGTSRKVLFEYENKDGFLHGFTENYVKVKTEFDPELIHQLCDAALGKIDSDGDVLIEKLNPSFAIQHS
ncbi:MAG TPA: tRNA (N(6)-L-threonylcarbamoyladenosine(37)-C(2))-methylthiotransferase MtaB [Bacteroidia bacterium]